jgi:hypothetical protein
MDLPDRRQWTRLTLAILQRRLSGFVGHPFPDGGQLLAKLEYGALDVASGHKVTGRRAPRR